MRYGCENKVVGNRLCSGEELGGQPVFDCAGNVWVHIFEVDSRRRVTVRLCYGSLPSVEAVC